MAVANPLVLRVGLPTRFFFVVVVAALAIFFVVAASTALVASVAWA